MTLSILRNIVEAQYNRPNLLLALLFTALPSILLLAAQTLFGFNADIAQTALAFGKEIIYIALAALLMYVLLMAFKGSAVKGKYQSILSALSVNYLVLCVFSILMIILVLIAIPSFFSALASFKGANLNFNEVYAIVSVLDKPAGQVLWVVTAIMGLLGLAAVFCGLYVVFKIGTLTKETTGFSNSVFTVVFIVLSFLLNAAISGALGLFI